MATSGFSCGKSAVEWNVLLYLWWLGVGSTPLKASLITLANMLLKPGEKTPMKNLFTLIFVFFILQSFAQEYGKEGYQEKRFDEAIQSLKEKEF